MDGLGIQEASNGGSLTGKIKEWFTLSENWLVNLFDIEATSRGAHCGRAAGPKTVKVPLETAWAREARRRYPVRTTSWMSFQALAKRTLTLPRGNLGNPGKAKLKEWSTRLKGHGPEPRLQHRPRGGPAVRARPDFSSRVGSRGRREAV
eukprot:1269555-Pyramimonas_sp.AAC.1